MINVIGDSHVNLFTGKEEMVNSWSIQNRTKVYNGNFRIFRLGAITATGIHTSRHLINTCLQMEVDKEHDDVIFSFGEVDVRAHLSRMIFVKNKPVEGIGPCVDEYMKFILEYCQQGYKISILGVPPSHCDRKDKPDISYGTCLQRNYIGRIWNNYLGSLCVKYQIPFPVVFDKLLLPDGNTNGRYMDGWVHLNQKCWPFMEEELRKYNLI
jgi:hypothetical protein